MVSFDNWDDLSQEEKDLMLDVGQLALDLIGIVEPTPFADSASAVISISRGDWWGTLISGVSMIPYVGDLAKLGKLSKYSQSLEKAISLARKSTKLRKPLEAVCDRIMAAIRKLPVDKLPQTARNQIERIQKQLSDFLPGGGMKMSRLDKLTDETLRHVFGSTKNVGILPRANVRVIVDFFSKHGVGNGNPAEWAELIKGIDLHALKPVEVMPMKAGELVAEYVELARPANRQIGQWMVRAQGAVSARNIGLSSTGRQRKVFRVKQSVEVLKSKAAAAADHWTLSGPKPHTAVTVENGSRLLKPAEQVAGGGDQYFLPQAWEYLEEVL